MHRIDKSKHVIICSKSKSILSDCRECKQERNVVNLELVIVFVYINAKPYPLNCC